MRTTYKLVFKRPSGDTYEEIFSTKEEIDKFLECRPNIQPLYYAQIETTHYYYGGQDESREM